MMWHGRLQAEEQGLSEPDSKRQMQALLVLIWTLVMTMWTWRVKADWMQSHVPCCVSTQMQGRQ